MIEACVVRGRMRASSPLNEAMIAHLEKRLLNPA
jgi:hypothetical protein